MSDRIDLSEQLATFSEHWSPRTIARFNDCDVMVVKVNGEFVWHKHDDTDDFFLVLRACSTSNSAIERSPLDPDKYTSCRRASSIALSPEMRSICC